MATFEELMEMYSNPGENGLPETFAAEMREAYTQDLSIRDAAVADRQAKIDATNELLAAEKAESLRLKAANYDLIKLVPGPGQSDNKEQPEDSDESLGVDSLFE